jgi:hypothetical protein
MVLFSLLTSAYLETHVSRFWQTEVEDEPGQTGNLVVECMVGEGKAALIGGETWLSPTVCISKGPGDKPKNPLPIVFPRVSSSFDSTGVCKSTSS